MNSVKMFAKEDDRRTTGERVIFDGGSLSWKGKYKLRKRGRFKVTTFVTISLDGDRIEGQ